MVSISKMVGSAVGAVDSAVIRAMQRRRKSARADAMSHADRLAAMDAAHASYEGDLAASRFFPSPPKTTLLPSRIRAGVWEAAWPSTFEPFLPAVAERYLSFVENRTARARFYFASPPEVRTDRPAVIAIHGYMAGQWVFEENQWPVSALVRRGLDVVLPVLPFHAARAGNRRGGAFPNADPRVTNEGFRQAVADLRTLIRFLRDRGAPHVGVIGMSLGGYTTALLGTVTNEIDFIMPMIPLSSIASFAREQGRLGEGTVADEQHAALERANWIASPLARPLAIPKNRALVVGAEFDRVTPIEHAKRIATHFDCEMMTMRGAHFVQLGRTDAFRALLSMLEREHILEKRSGSAR